MLVCLETTPFSSPLGDGDMIAMFHKHDCPEQQNNNICIACARIALNFAICFHLFSCPQTRIGRRSLLILCFVGITILAEASKVPITQLRDALIFKKRDNVFD